ncbi:RING-H2 finger protein ATL72 [Apostasia shenzhenica]|uniref:RING-H2 finger protein ATL72 n=1 Tax=Apostasia shenzhenica TaxID=1088818 RepID=A0A2I0B5R7_9ASPA|nr:RING-H2 finger protein ATL72 [Apostasia shenzhenica]
MAGNNEPSPRASIYLVLFSVFLTAVILTLYHWITLTCARRRSGSGPGPTFPTAAGVGPQIASSEVSTAQLILPARTYGKGEGLVAGDEPTCPVCLSDFEDGNAVCLLPECAHCFHVECIDQWLRSHSTCPVCRASLLLPDPSPAMGGIAGGRFR